MRGRRLESWIFPLFLAGFIQPNLGQAEPQKVKCYDSVDGTVYNYGALTIDGDEYVPFRRFVGKLILFVNVATFWGLTMQYLELNALQTTLGPYGLVILGFPANNFGKQEPGENNEILNALKYVRPGGGFVPNFQLFQKGDVNGEKEQKIYTFLKNACPPVTDNFGDPSGRLFWHPLKIHDIKWNFEKFLVNTEGKPVLRWYHATNVATVKNDIIQYMKDQGMMPYG